MEKDFNSLREDGALTFGHIVIDTDGSLYDEKEEEEDDEQMIANEKMDLVVLDATMGMGDPSTKQTESADQGDTNS
mgnify:CR=1 FL=1